MPARARQPRARGGGRSAPLTVALFACPPLCPNCALLKFWLLQVSSSAKAGLQFPVGRIARYLKKGRYAERIGAGAPVYLAAVLEYLAAEVLELSGNAARDNKKTRIIPRHIQLAVRNDEELSKLLAGVTIAEGGVLPNIHSVLLPKKSGKKKGGEQASMSQDSSRCRRSWPLQLPVQALTAAEQQEQMDVSLCACAAGVCVKRACCVCFFNLLRHQYEVRMMLFCLGARSIFRSASFAHSTATVTVERVTINENKGLRFARTGGEMEPRTEPGYDPLLPAEAPPVSAAGPLSMEQHQQRTLWAAGMHLAKLMMGIGILALPRVFGLLGVGTATIWLIFIAGLTGLSMHSLTKATTRTGLLNYSEVVREQLGVAAQAVLDLAVIANGFGLMVIMLVVAGDILVGDGHSEGLLSPECGDRRTVLAVVVVLLLVPLVSARRTRTTAGASLMGVVAIYIWAGITLALFVVAAYNNQLHRIHWWPHSSTFTRKGFESAVQMVAVLPILVVAYLCQMSLGHTMHDLTYLRERQLDKVSAAALSLSSIAFLIIAVCSCGIFGAKNVHPDILRNFTVKALSPLVWTRLAQASFMLVRLGFLVSLLATFPLQMAPFRDSLFALLFRQQLQGPGLYLVTYLTLVGVYFSAAFITNIWQPLIILGSTAGVLIAFVIPGLLAASLDEALTETAASRRGRGTAGILLAVVGAVIGVSGLVRVIFYKDPISD
ncbi:Histone H2AX [Chlorella vulgaris]